MNRKIYVIAVGILLLGSSLVQSQGRSAATDQGAKLVSGAFSFASQGGDLYAGGDDRANIVTIVPSLIYFISPGIGIGGDLSYARQSQGDFSATEWGAGPKIGFFMDSGGSMIPFIAAGANYLSFSNSFDDDSENLLRFKVAGGILIRKDHLAVSIEAGYLLDRFKPEGADESVNGNTIVIGIGFAGFLFN